MTSCVDEAVNYLEPDSAHINQGRHQFDSVVDAMKGLNEVWHLELPCSG